MALSERDELKWGIAQRNFGPRDRGPYLAWIARELTFISDRLKDPNLSRQIPIDYQLEGWLHEE
jgi:hypothetical protein